METNMNENVKIDELDETVEETQDEDIGEDLEEVADEKGGLAAMAAGVAIMTIGAGAVVAVKKLVKKAKRKDKAEESEKTETRVIERKLTIKERLRGKIVEETEVIKTENEAEEA